MAELYLYQNAIGDAGAAALGDALRVTKAPLAISSKF